MVGQMNRVKGTARQVRMEGRQDIVGCSGQGTLYRRGTLLSSQG
jgi:hypothetical protein